MKNTGCYRWLDRMTDEECKQRAIRSLELQIVDRERDLARLREALSAAQR